MPNQLRYFIMIAVLIFSLGFFVQTIQKDFRKDRETIQLQREKQEQSEERTLPTSGEVEPYEYRLGLVQEKVVVYKTGNQAVYEYTNLELKNLPNKEQEEILLGKGFQTEADLYAFLETYSS